jgi:hypothetical protein
VLLLLWQFGCEHDIELFDGKVPAGLSSERPVMRSTQLRIEPPGARITNEYRLKGETLELRVRDRSSCFYPSQGTTWRPLTEDELNTHVALNTVVAQWMSSKIWHPT